jgi:hypothetical protein
MSVNITYPELAETKSQPLPAASIEILKQLRDQSASTDFKLQNYQRFLRRVLSPDSSTRCLLMVHGTGTGKTCTAIQIAEEYIIRPEFQDKRVLVLANPAVQENFKTQIFNVSKVIQDPNGMLLSKQCTGRRYLDMLQRIQSEPLKWSDNSVKEKMNTIVQRIITEFYEFQGYRVLANMLERETEIGGETHLDAWIHKTFDNRMIIVDEAHSLRDTSDETSKIFSMALETIIQKANNVTLILLTATPMFDTYAEIIYYFTLFLWNDRKLKPPNSLQVNKIFDQSGNFLEGAETLFRGWCQDYVSFIKGDNPFTFPFRLPPPLELIAPPAKRDIRNKAIPVKERRNTLTLTQSFVQGTQAAVLTELKSKGRNVAPEVVCVLPKNEELHKVIVSINDEDAMYAYAKGVPTFLAPSQIADYSSKFALVNKILNQSKGIVLVYSNLVQYGARLFAMCLEEHGYEPASGKRNLKTTSGEVERGSKGKYVMFIGGGLSDVEVSKTIQRLKRRENKDGKEIRVIIASQRVSEGVDLQYVRQVHVLDYWFNMSRIEQVVGRGIRTLSHQALPFEEQNCTVYLHVCKLPNSDRELLDEAIYRLIVETKAREIAKIKKIVMESSMDCPLQYDINSLPKDWRNLEVKQIRSQNNVPITLTLEDMASPTFGTSDLVCKIKESTEDPEHERPLSAYVDVRDELLDKFLKLFLKKPIWKKEDLLSSPQLQLYNKEVLIYTLQNAIESGFQLKDRHGRIGYIETKGSMYAYTPGKFIAMQDRYIPENKSNSTPLTIQEEEQNHEDISITQKRMSYKWIDTTFSEEVMNWYIVDTVLTPSERLHHMRNLDWSNPPIYAKPLLAHGLRILGSNQIYNENDERITPIGDQADVYAKWVSQRIELFLATKSKFFATMKDNNILFNLDDKSDDLQKAPRTKNIGGRNCKSYPTKLMNLFSEWLGKEFTKNVKTNPDRCQFLGLLIRDAILKKNKDIVWWTPEEWSIINEDANRKELLVKLKE